MSLPRLLVITDRSQLPLGRGLLATMRECRAAGLSHVVLRELDEPVASRAALCAALADLGVTVIAAHTPLPAARGVHLPATAGQGPPEPRAAGQLAGRSCHTGAEVEAAAAAGFDYVTLGPYAASDSKPGYGPPVPRAAYAGHRLPVFALGGVTVGSARRALDDGAYGVAVMGGVMRAADPAAVVADLVTAVAR